MIFGVSHTSCILWAMEKLKDIVIIYHAKCRDGFGAAFAAWKKFGDKASYVPWSDHSTTPANLENKEIYVVDFSFPKELLEELCGKNKSVVVIDHHETAKDAVTAFPDNVFDMEHSGAVLAWQYFHPDTNVPTLLNYIEDMDLWKYELEHSREFSAALGEYFEDFETWEKLEENLCDRDDFSKFISLGTAIAGFEDKHIETVLQYREKALFEGHEIFVLNAERTYRSILGHRLAQLNGEEGRIEMGIVYYHAAGKVSCSLRSNGDVDVATMAAKHGGGGHKNAAGMDFPSFNDLPFTFVGPNPK